MLASFDDMRASLPGIEMEDSAEAPLLRIVSDIDLLACLVGVADAATIARLACCCRAARRKCMANALWAGLVHARWPDADTLNVDGQIAPAHRVYASRHVSDLLTRCAPTLTPRTGNQNRLRRRRPEMARGPSPAARIRIPLATISPVSVNSAAQPSSPSGGTLGPCTPVNPCAVARLKRGLSQLLASDQARLSAFPLDEAMEVWKATIRTSAGGIYGGKAFQLQLCFDLSRVDADLPAVQLLQPACFHPNVSADGTVCPRALQERCQPLEPIATILRNIAELFDRPCFSVHPANSAAAESWYGDPSLLRERARTTMQGVPPKLMRRSSSE